MACCAVPLPQSLVPRERHFRVPKMMTNSVPVFSYGMGVESTALLLRLLEEPSCRDFDIGELIVISAQTGDEWEDTGRDVERHILPRLRKHNVRYVQVGRGGHFERDGIFVLDDSRQPQRCMVAGHYKLSDELRAAGTVPQFGGEHRCSLKFKAFVIETWMNENIFDPVRHTFGYNAEEQARVAKSDAAIAGRARITFGFNADELTRVNKGKQYDRPDRVGHYPLVEWGWGRARCLAYIKEMIGVEWRKSACVQCPFAAVDGKLLARQREFPAQTAEAMILERLSLAMNPRGQLFKKQPLYQIVGDSGNVQATVQVALREATTPWALYRVRRMYHGKGKARRCVERLREFASKSAAFESVIERGQQENLRIREMHGLSYAYVREREQAYPTKEEYYVAALAVIDAKARHGMENFDARWQKMDDLYCGRDDLPLFSNTGE